MGHTPSFETQVLGTLFSHRMLVYHNSIKRPIARPHHRSLQFTPILGWIGFVRVLGIVDMEGRSLVESLCHLSGLAVGCFGHPLMCEAASGGLHQVHLGRAAARQSSHGYIYIYRLHLYLHIYIIYIYIYLFIYTHVYVYRERERDMLTCIYIYIYIFIIYIYIQLCVCARLSVPVCVCVFVCVSLCIRVCLCGFVCTRFIFEGTHGACACCESSPHCRQLPAMGSRTLFRESVPSVGAKIQGSAVSIWCCSGVWVLGGVLWCAGGGGVPVVGCFLGGCLVPVVSPVCFGAPELSRWCANVPLVQQYYAHEHCVVVYVLSLLCSAMCCFFTLNSRVFHATFPCKGA